tara:strand:- start:290 stop:1099 length:810 start_codon:yes stop_codon:yes gene_type:complete
MVNRRFPNWGYKGRPPRTLGTEGDVNSETLQGVKNHEEAYMFKIHNTAEYPQDGLLQYVDKRFYTSGSTWADQSGNGYNMTINGTVTQSTSYGGTTGTFHFAQGQTSKWLNMGTAIRNLSSASAWSMVFVSRASFGGNRYGLSIANSGNNNLHIIGNDSEWKSWKNGIDNSSQPGTYQMFVYYYNGTNAKLYESRSGGITHNVGGTQSDIRSNSYFVLNQEQDANLGSFDANQSSDWYISAFMLYDKVLSSTERTELQSYFVANYPIAT